MNKRLYRSETDRVVGGVCAGLAVYLGIPAIVLRVFFILWMILGEFSLPVFIMYIMLWCYQSPAKVTPAASALKTWVFACARLARKWATCSTNPIHN